MSWAVLALAFAAFFLSHSVPLRPPVRKFLEARLGARGFSLAYSAASLAVLVWLVAAADRAPFVPLWDWAPWQSAVTLCLMAMACLLFTASVARPNPLSFGGRGDARFDPARPGLFRVIRHPLLMVLALWSSAHLVANGDLAHVLLFGTFFVFSLMGGRMVDRRRRHEMGEDWSRLVVAMRKAPPWRTELTWPEILLRMLAGAGLYVGLIALHPLVIGVAPLP
ncbi:NnrU family protein (plasmid) [Salipiger sp. H15]|uniref:NnrU family protein n=1 Tax=Alloyangia sp. H15 TaxID=3029062 RepID=A0AAU8AV73_9RHOB